MDTNFLKKKREQIGLSQSQLAKKSGINLRTLQDYEQGRKPLASVKGEVLYRISTVLNVDMEDLILEPVYPEDDSSGRMYKYYVQFEELCRAWHNAGGEESDNGRKKVYTSFDDVFRTLSVDCSRLLIPVINEAFGESYDTDDLIEHYQNEHLKAGGEGTVNKAVSDSNFVVLTHMGRKIRYQIECQSTEDNSILLRIFEYSSAIASESAAITRDRMRISYPRSALIYLRASDSVPDVMTIELNTPGGDVSWQIPVIKTSRFTIDELFEKKLYMFVPYYILVYEKELKNIERNQNKLELLSREYMQIRYRLDVAAREGMLSEYDKTTVVNMSLRVLNYFSDKYNQIGEEVGKAMGGKVLEYEAKDIKREGISEGIKEGINESIALLKEMFEIGMIDEKTLNYYMANVDKKI